MWERGSSLAEEFGISAVLEQDMLASHYFLLYLILVTIKRSDENPKLFGSSGVLSVTGISRYYWKFF